MGRCLQHGPLGVSRLHRHSWDLRIGWAFGPTPNIAIKGILQARSLPFWEEISVALNKGCNRIGDEVVGLSGRALAAKASFEIPNCRDETVHTGDAAKIRLVGGVHDIANGAVDRQSITEPGGSKGCVSKWMDGDENEDCR